MSNGPPMALIEQAIIQSVSKSALQLRNLIYIYSEDIYSVLNGHNGAKQIEFYLG
jgi:hypothetical protein